MKSEAGHCRQERHAPISSPCRPAWPTIGSFAVIIILFHFAVANAFGYFRDELYFVACGDHLAWGYVDLPPAVAGIAKLSTVILGRSLFALRFFPALAAGATVAIAGGLAWELGGNKCAQMLAMLAVMAAPAFIGFHIMLTMNAFDPIFWMGCVWALIRIVKTGDSRWWLVFGVSAGLGFENKASIAFLCVALLIPLLTTSQRRLLFNRWFCLALAIGALIAMPTALWQVRHQLPMIEELISVRSSATQATLFSVGVPTQQESLTWSSLLHSQIKYFLPLSFPVWAAGLYFFLIAPRGRQFRAIGWSYLLLYVAFVVLKGKTYYIAPIFPVLFAAGAVQLASVDNRGWSQVIHYVLPAAILIEGIATFSRAIPHPRFYAWMKHPGAESIWPVSPGTEWSTMVAKVAEVFSALPPQDRSRAAIFASNYGEAAAIDYYGAEYGLPKAISGHMAYFLWGPRSYTTDVWVVVGSRRKDLERAWNSVTEMGSFDMMGSAEHGSIFVCRAPRLSIAELWPLAKTYR